MERILVTGADGQLGKCLQRIADNHPYEFTFLGSSGLDITDMQTVMEKTKELEPAVIINCAAYTAVDKAETEREACMKVNRDGARNLALAAAAYGSLLVHISTDYVFSGKACIPYSESDTTCPANVYGQSKLEGEKAIESSGCRYMILRTSWLYSEFGNNFVKTIRRLSSERKNLKVVFDQTGSPTYAADLAEAIMGIVASDNHDRKESGIFNCTGTGICSWFDLATECALPGCTVEPCLGSEYRTIAERPHYSVLDNGKLRAVFGIRMPYWRHSLERCITGIMNLDGNHRSETDRLK